MLIRSSGGIVVAPALPVVVSYSGGSSSEWLVEAIIQGVLPRAEHLAVMFADTGEEHDWTYEAVSQVEARCRAAGITFIRCARHESLGDHLLSFAASTRTRGDFPPLYVAKEGGDKGRVQQRCTREFKVAVLRRATSAWLKSLGLRKRVEKWIGFGADEVSRALLAESKQNAPVRGKLRKRPFWEQLAFPAVRLRMTRAMQRKQLIEWTGRAPNFSMCTICPHKTPLRWLQTPERQRARVVQVDEAMRDLSRAGITQGDAYLCDRLIPVADLFRNGDPVPEMETNESDCTAGACFV